MTLLTKSTPIREFNGICMISGKKNTSQTKCVQPFLKFHTGDFDSFDTALECFDLSLFSPQKDL